MTHAFFKGLLFLCAGSVIHALDGEQDMSKMGALRQQAADHLRDDADRRRSRSARCRRFSGYFSKDLDPRIARSPRAIAGLWLIGIITAGITAFYMFRLIFMTFHRRARGSTPDKAITSTNRRR